MVERDPSATTLAAEKIAIDALSYLAADPALLQRFLALSGLESSDIRQAARESGFLAGVLDFFMEHESNLIAYAMSSNLSPDDIRDARQVLSAQS